MFLIIDLKRIGPERTPEIDYDHGVAPETLDGLTEEASTLPRDDGDEIEDQVDDDAFTSAGGGKVGNLMMHIPYVLPICSRAHACAHVSLRQARNILLMNCSP